MAESKLGWSASCGCNWVKLSGSGVTSDGGNKYSGSGTTPSISVTADDAKSSSDETTCTVTFTSEDGKTATLNVIRCPYGCGCDDYDVSVVNSSYVIPAAGVSGYEYFKIKNNNGCSISDFNGVSNNYEWLTISDGKITATQNTGSRRTGTIIFKYSGLDCPGKSYTISQEGRGCGCDDISLAATGVTVGCSGVNNATYNGLVTDTCVDEGNKKAITVSCDASWVSASLNSGNLTYSVNDRSADGDYGDKARVATVKFLYGGSDCSSKTFTITQGTCGCSCDEFTISGSKTVDVNCSGVTNMKLDASVIKVDSLCSTKPTVKEVRLGTSGGSTTNLVTASTNSDGTVTISVAKNEGENSRTFYVVFKMGDANTCDSTVGNMLKIVQGNGCQPKDPDPVAECSDITITTTPTTWECSDETGTSSIKTIGTISVKSGAVNPTGWTVTLNGVPSWITTGRTGNNITATINSKCTTSCEPRTATITFDAKNGDVSCSDKASVTVTQNCCANITITASPSELTCSGGTVTFSIST